MSTNVIPAAGAARYTHGLDGGRWVVMMEDTEGFLSVVQRCRSPDAAYKAADQWQKKENAAVTKANKSAECAR